MDSCQCRTGPQQQDSRPHPPADLLPPPVLPDGTRLFRQDDTAARTAPHSNIMHAAHRHDLHPSPPLRWRHALLTVPECPTPFCACRSHRSTTRSLCATCHSPSVSAVPHRSLLNSEQLQWSQLRTRWPCVRGLSDPLVLGYSVYSLVHQTHKNWYSWVLGSLVGAVYTFGFITMTPQLYINYKLKSVAVPPPARPRPPAHTHTHALQKCHWPCCPPRP